MPIFLSQRDTESSERMDNPDCDSAELENTYRQFYIINSLISRWRYIYKKILRPELKMMGNSGTLLDIGFGGGDIPVKLAEWSSEDGIKLSITAIDNDKRALQFVDKIDCPPEIQFLHKSSTELLHKNRRFDFVISNHLLHHLDHQEFNVILREARRLSNRTVLFNDIKRSDLGYLLFNIFSRPVFRSSFITSDGLTSIKRSYTYRELYESVPEGWQVKRLFPFRLLLIYRHE